VQTDTADPPAPAREFMVWAVAASVVLFGLLRLNWVEVHVILPLIAVQGGLAASLFGVPILPVETTLACSGGDALAVCLGAVLAYPVAWRARLTGAAAGLVLILALNSVRIGTLGLVAALPVWFNTLHVYVWPGVLTLAIAGYVFAWMRFADRQHPRHRPPDDSGAVPVFSRPLPSSRFIALTVVFVLLFVAASPLYFESPAVLAVAGWIASTAAGVLSLFGVSAHASANELWTPRGGFLVTQECIVTPLIPIYLAAVCAYAATFRARIGGLLATLPLFIVLGIVRLLVVALPDAIAPPLMAVHAFYQVLLGAIVVFAAARWRHGSEAPVRALGGIIAGLLFVQIAGPHYTSMIAGRLGALEDPQGAIALLPSFQIGLYLALWAAAFTGIAWPRVVAGLVILGLTQSVGLFALDALATHSGLLMHVRGIRSWAVAGPVLIFIAVTTRVWPPR
jgi:exosortase/archaeosortase family protein